MEVALLWLLIMKNISYELLVSIFIYYKSEVFSCPFHLSHKEKHYCCEVLLDGFWDSINVVSALPVKKRLHEYADITEYQRIIKVINIFS